MKVAAVTYYHIELPQHDIVLAEGLPTESFLDTGNRDAFANGGGVTQIHPDSRPAAVVRTGDREHHWHGMARGLTSR